MVLYSYNTVHLDNDSKEHQLMMLSKMLSIHLQMYQAELIDENLHWKGTKFLKNAHERIEEQ